jgi:hypothetical protein
VVRGGVGGGREGGVLEVGFVGAFLPSVADQVQYALNVAGRGLCDVEPGSGPLGVQAVAGVVGLGEGDWLVRGSDGGVGLWSNHDADAQVAGEGAP